MIENLLPIIKSIVSSNIDEHFIKCVWKRLESFGYAVVEADVWVIAFAIEKVENSIKNSCNISLIPDGLKNTAINMVCGEFLFAKKQSGNFDGFDFEIAVKQVQVGDTNVTFSDKDATVEQRFDGLIATLMNSGKDDFVCYRRIKW